MGKHENWHLLLSHCRYFDKSFTEMFLEWSSTKHTFFVVISLVGYHGNQKAKFANCFPQSQLLRRCLGGKKLELCSIVSNNSLYKNLVFFFYCRCSSTLVAMAT